MPELLDGHPLMAGVHSLAFDPSGQRLLTADVSEIKQWSLALGQVTDVLRLRDRSGPVGVAWVPDLGIVLAPFDQPVQIKGDSLHGRVLKELGIEGTGHRPAVSANGRYLALGGQTWPVLWDLREGRDVRFRGRGLSALLEPRLDRRRNVPSRIISCDLSTDGLWLATLTAGGRLSLWSVEQQKQVKSMSMPEALCVFVVDAGQVVVVERYAVVRLQWMSSDEPLRRTVEDPITYATIQTDKRRLALGYSSGRLQFFATDAMTMAGLGRAGSQFGAPSAVQTISFAHGGEAVAVASLLSGRVDVYSESQTVGLSRKNDYWHGLAVNGFELFLAGHGGVLRWDVYHDQRSHHWGYQKDTLADVVPSANLVKVMDADGVVTMHQMDTRNQLYGPTRRDIRYGVVTQSWFALFMHPDEVGVWPIEAGQQPGSRPPSDPEPRWRQSYSGQIRTALADAGGQYLLWVSWLEDPRRPNGPGRVKLQGLRWSDGKPLDLPPCSQPQGLAMSRQGVAALPTAEGLRLWHVGQGKSPGLIPVQPTSATFNASGDLLAVSSGSRLLLWSMAAGQVILNVDAEGWVTFPVFLAQDRLLAALVDGVVRLWDRETGQALCTLTHGASWMVYAPDGRYDGPAGSETALSGDKLRSVPDLLIRVMSPYR